MGKTTATSELFNLVKKGTADECLGELISLEPGGEAWGGNIAGPHYDNAFTIADKHIWLDKFIAYRLEQKKKGEYISKIGIIDSTTMLESIAESKATTTATAQGEWNVWTKEDISSMSADSVAKLKAVEKGVKPTNMRSSVLLKPYGAGQNYLREATANYMDSFSSIYDIVIYLGHLADKLVLDDKTAISVSFIDLIGKNKALVTRSMDYIAILIRDYATGKGILSSKQVIKTEKSTASRYAYLDNVHITITQKDLVTGKMTWYWDAIFPFMGDYEPLKN
jgi:hypothetical protein